MPTQLNRIGGVILAFSATVIMGGFVTADCPDQMPSNKVCLIQFPICGGWALPQNNVNCGNREEKSPLVGLFGCTENTGTKCEDATNPNQVARCYVHYTKCLLRGWALGDPPQNQGMTFCYPDPGATVPCVQLIKPNCLVKEIANV